MPKAAPGSRVSARLATPGAEGVGEDALLGGQSEGEAALEAVAELDGKFEAWHLQAKQDAADAQAASAAGQERVQAEIQALTALVAKLGESTDRARLRAGEGDPPEGVSSPEPEPASGRGTPDRLTRSDPLEKAEDELLRLQVEIGGVGARSIVVQFEEGSNLVVSFFEYSIAHVCLLG